MHFPKSFSFLLLIFISCYFNISSNAQRVVFISSYLGNYCDDGMDALDEDVKLFRDVFGDEDDGGWQRFTFDEIDSAAEFLDNTCLLFLDGFCDDVEFFNFYELYRTDLENYVNEGGNLYLNYSSHDYDSIYDFGFEGVHSKPLATIYSFKFQDHEILEGPVFPVSGLYTARWGQDPF
ncbi:MAG: hypothetical protein IPH61_08455 [Bacteroidetes bacterium]|nr:hypothetical protein [Bacteroidota bacterium]